MENLCQVSACTCAASTMSVQPPVIWHPCGLCLQEIACLQTCIQQSREDAECRAAAVLEEKNRLLGQVFDLEQQTKQLQEDKQQLQEIKEHLQQGVNDTAKCIKVSLLSSAKSKLLVCVRICVCACVCADTCAYQCACVCMCVCVFTALCRQTEPSHCLVVRLLQQWRIWTRWLHVHVQHVS